MTGRSPRAAEAVSGVDDSDAATDDASPGVTHNHLRGSALLFAGRILAIVLNFIVQVITVRYLTKADYGAFAFAVSVVAIASVLSAFGADKTASRFLPVYLQKDDRPRFWGALILLFGTVLVTGLGIIIFVVGAFNLGFHFLTDDSHTQMILLILIGLTVCDALEAVFVSLFAVLANPAAIFVRRHLVGPLLKIVAVMSVVGIGGDVYAFATALVIAALCGLALNVAMLWRTIMKNPALRQPLHARITFPIREMLGYSATLLHGDIVFLLRGAMIPVLLGIWHTSESVAVFQAVFPVARLNNIVLMTFSVLFLPNAAKTVSGTPSHGSGKPVSHDAALGLCSVLSCVRTLFRRR